MRKSDFVLRAALVIGGGYLLYRLFNNPATPGVTPATGAPTPAPNIQQSLDTALTQLATGVTGIIP